MTKKKPDIVVWSEEKGYYAKSLPYGTDLAAPSIKPENITAWKQAQSSRLNSHFQQRFEEIKREYQSFIEEYKWNDILYKAKYSFEPVVGRTYYLYSQDEGLYLSLISPEEWRSAPDFVGAFRLSSSFKWEKID
jgi:hypothetical protein